MARNGEKENINKALEDLNRKERVRKLTRGQKAGIAATGVVALVTAYAGAQAGNNESLQQEASEAADESFISASEAEAHAKRLGNEIAAAVEEGEIAPIIEVAETGDGYSTLRGKGLERMYEDGEEVKGDEDAEYTEYTPLPVELMEEVNGAYPKVGQKVMVGFASKSEYAQNFREQLEANPLTEGPR